MCLGAETDPTMPSPEILSEGKGPTASQDMFGATAAKMTEILPKITQTFEEINKHLVDGDKRLDDLRQEWESGDSSAQVTASGGPRNTPSQT